MKRGNLGWLAALAALVGFCVLLLWHPWTRVRPGTQMVTPEAPPTGGKRRPAPKPIDDGILRIVLDPGHGGKDGGAVANGLIEKNLTIDVAHRVRKLLEKEGIVVVMTRTDDTTLTLPDRIQFANKYFRAFFISIHFNSALTSRAKGVETFYSQPRTRYVESVLRHRLGWAPDTPIIDGRGPTFARQLQRAMVDQLGAVDRGIKNDPTFAVTSHTIAPAALVECGFIANPTEARVIKNEGYRDKIAQAITTGIKSYLRISRENPYTLVHRDNTPES